MESGLYKIDFFVLYALIVIFQTEFDHIHIMDMSLLRSSHVFSIVWATNITLLTELKNDTTLQKK